MNKSISQLINVYKPIGITPAQLIDEFRIQNKEFKNQSISHAGKLDPLAEGLMLLVTGEYTRQHKLRKLMRLDKEYRAKILFGFSTDSHDIQGLPSSSNTSFDKINQQELIKKINELKGEYEQEVPVFSGRKVNNKPLYYYARNNKLNEITIPKEKVLIKSIILNSIEKISSKQLLNQIKEKINLLDGDFRQEEILSQWNKLLSKDNNEYLIADITLSCSSGTYVRAIAHDLGKQFGSATLLNLIRTKLGNATLKDAIKLN